MLCGQFKLVYLRSLDHINVYVYVYYPYVFYVYLMFIYVVIYWLIAVVNWCFSANIPICMAYIF